MNILIEEHNDEEIENVIRHDLSIIEWKKRLLHKYLKAK